MKNNYIGEQITALRVKKDISEYALSKKIGKCENYINKVSSGKIKPSIDVLQDICDFFGITMGQFFADDKPKLSLTAMQIVSILSELTEEQLKSLLVIVNSMKNNA